MRWLILTTLLLANSATAYWAEAGDGALRHHLQRLDDAGAINLPLGSWPLAWETIGRALERIDPHTLPPQLEDSFRWLMGRWQRQRETGISNRTRLSLASEPSLLRGFGEPARHEQELSLGIAALGEGVAAGLTINAIYDEGGSDHHFDNSHLTLFSDNWALSAESLERWWGPGWEGSLILGHAARPVPALSLRRIGSEAADTPWFSWLGPWHLTLSAARLEENRTIPSPWLFTARLDFKPTPGLEIGLSRAAQWGGEGRPENLKSFGDMIAGLDNPGDPGHAGVAKQPGNQLAGADLRWVIPGDLPLSLYLQAIGEDQASMTPTARMYLFGVGQWGALGRRSYRVNLEYVDTATYRGFDFSDRSYGTAYDHYIYLNGYRYLGRSLGYSGDSDTKMVALRLRLEGSESGWEMTLRNGVINRDGGPSNPLVEDRRVRYRGLALAYSRELVPGVALRLVAMGEGLEAGAHSETQHGVSAIVTLAQ